jgi:hypothetical protein
LDSELHAATARIVESRAVKRFIEGSPVLVGRHAAQRVNDGELPYLVVYVLGLSCAGSPEGRMFVGI